MPHEPDLHEVFNSDEIDLYAEGAPLFDTVYSSFDTEDAKEQVVRKHVDEGDHILDLGCGTGILAERLDSDYYITGLDNSREMLEIAREKELDAEFVQGDMRSMPFQDEFDAVIMFGQPLSHLPGYQNAQDAIRSAYESLEDRGILLTEFYDERAGMIPFMDPVVVDTSDGKIGMTAEFSNYDRDSSSWDGELYFSLHSEGENMEVVSRQELIGFSPYDIGETLVESGFSVVDSDDLYESNMNHLVTAVK